ncbi:VOC family protein [Pseudonocardia eucalypti]|uniref:VOC family protein n=1 Tax=Pseudonocardia eucalypti TaxID=648755 RepID=A0ABP9QJT8_9PSEU|nr:catechol 2,3-dioxygenase-like lactoylglutathione lyase family enzyme [Pseudonocardia eucalypti]
MTSASQQARVPEPGAGFRPKEYAHVVFRTAQPEALIDWYRVVLGMQVVLRHPAISFLTWDESQDRLAIVADEDAQPAAENSVGFHHAAFEVGSLKELTEQYRALKAREIVPERAINHGVATSLYYRDPDGNQIELTVEAFATVAELNQWLATGLFDTNPLGVFIDPEELCARVESGESEADILKPHARHAEFLTELMAGKNVK